MENQDYNHIKIMEKLFTKMNKDDIIKVQYKEVIWGGKMLQPRTLEVKRDAGKATPAK